MPKPLLWLWASPWTVCGLLVGGVGLLTGGGVQRRCGVIEFYGGWVTRFLENFPVHPTAMTLGHVVLGRAQTVLDACREHELVHVRQSERWGPLFVPAYFASSLLAWRRGGNPYFDNAFEREAYRTAP